MRVKLEHLLIGIIVLFGLHLVIDRCSCNLNNGFHVGIPQDIDEILELIGFNKDEIPRLKEDMGFDHEEDIKEVDEDLLKELGIKDETRIANIMKNIKTRESPLEAEFDHLIEVFDDKLGQYIMRTDHTDEERDADSYRLLLKQEMEILTGDHYLHERIPLLRKKIEFFEMLMTASEDEISKIPLNRRYGRSKYSPPLTYEIIYK